MQTYTVLENKDVLHNTDVYYTPTEGAESAQFISARRSEATGDEAVLPYHRVKYLGYWLSRMERS
jgi:hypothetical protein